MLQNEKIIEIKTCKHCETKFEITDKDLEFYEKVSPVFGGERYNIPIPTLCPDCRQHRRLSFRNERNLYRRKCDFSGKEVVSIYSPDKEYKAVSPKLWTKEYEKNYLTKDFDFGRSFFEQFNELYSNTIKPSLYQSGDIENSDYTNFCGYLKNCYLCFDSGKNENCYYSTQSGYSSYVCDSLGSMYCNESYQIIDVTNSYKLYYSEFCDNCKQSIFLRFCNGCTNCIGCVNLNNAEYCIFNKKVTKEEFESVFKIILSSRNKLEEFKNKCYQFFLSQPVKYYNGLKNENVSGDIIFESKNIKNSYGVVNSEDCSYCTILFPEAKDCYDIDSFAENSFLLYEMTASGGSIKSKEQLSKSAFGTFIYYGGNNVYYSINCQGGSENCFGCCDLIRAKYCILNHQYTKQEYEQLVPKIIEHMMKTGEWGEFFPSSISPFGYNETVAMEYFPIPHLNPLLTPPPNPILSKEGETNEVSGEGLFNWSTYEQPFPKVEKIIPANKLPENISDIPDDILNWAIECEITKKPFRIIKQELEFYRKHNLPIPKRHPDQRHLDRIKLRNPRKLFDRKCDKCGVDMKTTYSPDREEIVYCQTCYDKEIY